MAVTNGWGKGVENNTIGWGKSADNATNGFGSVYASSAAGDTSLGSSYDADAVAYFTAIEDAGGTLTDNVKAEFNAFVVREKDAGRWSNIKRLYPYLGGVINSAIIDAVTLNSATNTNFVDGDVDSLIGLQGDASTKYLQDTGSFSDIVTDPRQSLQFGVFYSNVTSDSITNNVFPMGTLETSYFYLRNNAGGSANAYSVATTAMGSGTYTTSSRFHGSLRFSNTSAFGKLDSSYSSELTTDVSAYTLPVDNVVYFGRSVAGTPSASTDDTLAGAFIAENLTQVEVDAFESSYKTFINNITAYAAAQAYFSAVESAGGTLTDNVKAEFTSFVSREVEANRWSKIKRLYPFLGGIIDSARIDAINLGQATNTNFVDADVDATIGLQGDGSTKYLTDVSTYSSIVSSQYKVQQGAIYIGATGETSIPYLFGAINSGNYIASRYFNSSLIRSYVGLVSPYSQYAATIPVNASVVAARYSTTSAYTIVNNNTDLQDTSTTTYSFPAVAPSYFKANGAGGISSGKYSCHFISEFDTLQETKDFTTSYKTFINNIQAYAAAQAYFTAVESAGGTLSDNVKAEFTSFVSREVEAGRWSKIKRLYPYLGGVIDSAIIDAVTTNAATNNNFVDGDVDATIGLQGDGSTKALVDTQAPSSIFDGNYDWGGYHLEITAALSAGDTFAWGAYDAAAGSQWAYTRRSVGNAPKTRGNLLTIEAVAGSFISDGGSYAYNKTSNTSTKIFVDGGSAVENTTTDTGTLSTTLMAYMAASNAGTLIGYCPAKVGGQALWSGFTDADIAAFDASYKTFINNITA